MHYYADNLVIAMKDVRTLIKAMFAVAAFLVPLACHAKVKAVSPAPGTWGNRQVLALEMEDGKAGEVFYSLDGRDPAVFGFAYDGPVLLDKGGDVSLRIAVLLQGGEREEYAVDYTVKDRHTSEPFLKEAVQTGFIDCTAGKELSIPPSLHYSIEGGAFEGGRDISVPAACILKRTVPIVIDDGEGAPFCFVLRVVPAMDSTDRAEDVPFSIRGWENVTLEDVRRIYSIDGGVWLPCTGAGSPIVLDRKKRHTIAWQSVDYKKGNKVECFTLPPIPHLYTEEGEAGDVTITFGKGSADYKVGVIYGGALSLRGSAVLDTVYGDEAEGAFPVRVYYKGVYQGAIAIPYHVDRRRPSMPAVEATALTGSMTRGDVDVVITGERHTSLFVSVDEGEYEEAKGEAGAPSKSVRLTADKEAVHKVASYCVDSFGNVSDAAQYTVTIDKYNYFVDEARSQAGASGTASSPCASIMECLASSQGDIHITVRGRARLPSIDIRQNCTIEGEGADARLVIDGTLFARSNLTLKNLIVEGTGDGQKTFAAGEVLIKGENALIALENCEVLSMFDIGGTVISVQGGELNIKDSGVTGKARNFVSSITTADARAAIQDSRVSSDAAESVCVSCSGGDVDVSSSILRVSGKRAHAIELFGTKSRITGNILEAALSGGGSKSIYCDSLNTAIEHKDNTERGW